MPSGLSGELGFETTGSLKVGGPNGPGAKGVACVKLL